MKHVWLPAAVIGVTFLAYANSFHAPFLLDNNPIILRDPRVHEATAFDVHRILTQQYWETSPTGLYRPLTTLSFLFNYAILGNGADPLGYHWFNFILHAVNIVLVYALGVVIFDSIPAAAFLSALWGLHPVLTESVTNIVGRSDMLMAFSVLAGLLCHRKALSSSGMRKVVWIVAICAAAAIGIFSKESAVVLVGVFAIYDFTYGRSVSWRSRAPSYVAAAIPPVIYLYVRYRVLANGPYQAGAFFENPLLVAGFWTARMTAIKVIGKYLGLLIWPAQLSWDYGYNQIPLFGWTLSGWEDWKAIAALLVCAASAVAAIRSWRNQKPVFFAIAFFFVTLSPTSNLVILIGTIMGERLLYLPSVGFAIAVVWAANKLWRRLPARQPAYRYVVSAGMSVVLIGFAVRTYVRNADWLDPQRFWLGAAEVAPNSYKADMSAAANTYLGTQKDVIRSIRYADHALAILTPLPDSRKSPVAFHDAGVLYRNLGDMAASPSTASKVPAGLDAAFWYRKSLDALLHSERIELAWDERFQTENAKRGIPGLTLRSSKLYLDLGRTYLRLSDTPHAIEAFERGRALESDPDLLEELASTYRSAGELHKAALALVEALAVDPERTALTPMLVELYGQIDPQGCAVIRQGGTPSLNPDCPLVHADVCAASRNVLGNYLHRGQQFAADFIRNVAEHDLGCAAGLLNQ